MKLTSQPTGSWLFALPMSIPLERAFHTPVDLLLQQLPTITRWLSSLCWLVREFPFITLFKVQQCRTNNHSFNLILSSEKRNYIISRCCRYIHVHCLPCHVNLFSFNSIQFRKILLWSHSIWITINFIFCLVIHSFISYNAQVMHMWGEELCVQYIWATTIDSPYLPSERELNKYLIEIHKLQCSS